VAGFQVITSGRFWVIAKAYCRLARLRNRSIFYSPTTLVGRPFAILDGFKEARNYPDQGSGADILVGAIAMLPARIAKCGSMAAQKWRNTMTGCELIDTQRQQAGEASPEYQARWATYLQGRNAELAGIRVLDADYRHQLRIQPRAPWDRYAQDEADFELGQSYRILLGAVEDYLRNCVEVSCVTGESLLAQVSSADELVDMLQAKEDLMIATLGAPWGE
jgi:hypothetical protein